MAHRDKRANLVGNLLLREFPSRNRFVLIVIRTIYTAVYAVIRQVQRGKKNNAVAVKTLFDPGRQGINFLFQIRLLAGHEDGGLAVSYTFAKRRFLQDLKDATAVGTFPAGLIKTLQNLLVIDKFIGMGRLGIIHKLQHLW